jgi:serine/threonine protein kinase/WD40 repeat protein
MSDATDPHVTAARDQIASAAASADETAPQAAGTPRFAPPTVAGDVGTLGPYRVVKQLGAGGMGAVYLGIDTRLDRKLALKVMLPAFAADKEAKERFLREARSAAKVSHDNVVTVFEADERDGVPYIAMQFLQGYPLDEYLKNKGVPALAHIARIGREAALGLSAAHAQGLIHRDIKPGNIWLEAPNGRVKVLDFGLAKPVGSESELTSTGAVVGTPAYMSPEQARGLKVDARSDLFSLGALLYRLCTGRTPFAGPNVMAVLMALGSDDPTPVRELNPTVPQPLADLIHQLLAKKPEQRPQTAAEVAQRLRAVLDGLLRPGAAAVSAPASADVSASLPVVVHALPVQPNVAPMEVSTHNVFAGLDADDEPTEADPAAAAPQPEREPKRGGKGVLFAAVGAVVLAGAVVAAVALQMGKKPEPIAENTAPPDAPKPVPKADPAKWVPGPEWKPVPMGQSPFDKLDPNEIPKEERFDWQPKELVAVVGSHAQRFTGAAFGAAMSADGKLAAVAAADSRAALTIWDVETGKRKWSFQPPGGDFNLCKVRFAPDGKRLFFFTGDGGGWLTVYDLTGPKPVPAEYNLNDKPDGKAVFQWGNLGWGVFERDRFHLCEGGRTLVVWSANQLGLFDVSDGKPRFVEVKAIVSDPTCWPTVATDANKIPYLTPDKKLRIATTKNAKVESDEELPVPLGDGRSVRSISADGKRLAVWGRDGLQVWDVSRNPPAMLGTLKNGGDVRWDATFTLSLDGRWLTAAYNHTFLFRIDGAEIKPVGELDDMNGNGRVAFSADGSRAVVGSGSGFVRFWDLSGDKPKELPQPLDPSTMVVGTALDSRGGRALVRRPGNQYQLWDFTGPRPTPAPAPDVLLGSDRHMNSVAGGRWLESGWSRPFQFMELAEGKWRAAGEPFGQGNWHSLLSERPTLVAMAGDAPPFRLESWDLAARPNRVWSVDLPDLVTENGHNLFAGSGDGRCISTPRKAKDGSLELVLWRGDGGKPREYAAIPVKTDPGQYRSAFSPDGRFLFHNADAAHMLSVVDLSGREPRDLGRYEVGGILSLSPHPDGKKVAWSTYGRVGVMDAATGQTLWKWDAPGEAWVELAHDGRHLFVHNGNKTLYVLRLTNLNGERDRAAAEWALSVGGTVTVKDAAGEREVKAAKDLPKGGFGLLVADVRKSQQVTDSGLAVLADCRQLRELLLYDTPVSGAGLEYVKHCPALTLLGLGGSQVTDAGLAQLEGNTRLRNLVLSGCAQVTDAGIAHLKRCNGLQTLHVFNTAVTDDALSHLTGLDGLTELHVGSTKVTATGVQKLTKSLPRCKIIWDGGTIEPIQK